MWYKNGILVQGLQEETNYINHYAYQGVSAYHLFPLISFNDACSRALTDEQQSRRMDDGMFMSLEFISDEGLFYRYAAQCKEKNIPIRALFIESNYSEEQWEGKLPSMEFLGYEYTPIPFDEQVATDMDWYRPFACYWQKLNAYGLFGSLDEVTEFAEDYNDAWRRNEIGDGAADLYICRVFRVLLD